MARVADPMGLPGMDEPAARPPGDGLDADLETAGQGARRGVIGWVLLVLASLAYGAAWFMLAGLAVGLVPPTAESPVPGYLYLLLAVPATGLATGFTAGLPVLTTAVLGVVILDRRTAPQPERTRRGTTGPSAPPVDFGVAAGVLAVLVAVGTGVFVAQARRHFGREPRWGLSIFLGGVAAVVAIYASHIIAATIYYAQL